MLKLETTRTDKLTIATFGDEKRELEAANLVELTGNGLQNGSQLFRGAIGRGHT